MIKTKWTHPLQRLETIANTCHLDSLSRSFCLLAYQRYPFIYFDSPSYDSSIIIRSNSPIFIIPLSFFRGWTITMYTSRFQTFLRFFFLINWESRHVSRVVAETLNNTSGGYIDIDIAFLLLFEHSLFQALSN